jgi:hypothetical protein
MAKNEEESQIFWMVKIFGWPKMDLKKKIKAGTPGDVLKKVFTRAWMEQRCVAVWHCVGI